MNIHEYQAKEIFRKYSIPTLIGGVVSTLDDIDGVIDNLNATKFVIKAQIHAGGRGIGGGVKFADNKEEAKKIAANMLGSQLVTSQTSKAGQIVRKVYIEQACDILREYYCSLVLDRCKENILLILSQEGGIAIEETSMHRPEQIVTIPINYLVGLQNFHHRLISQACYLEGEQAKQLAIIVSNMYQIFLDKNANQIEINPLVLTPQGDLIALDAKINFDDNALFRHPDILAMKDTELSDPLEIEASNAGFSYVRMQGDIGCMVNGAGLAMATMDIIKLYGGEVANFLDVGGGADQSRVAKAFKILLADQKVKAILVNIFGGIVRCDIIARAIISAIEETGITVPLVVRLAGTNSELGNDILASSGLNIITAANLEQAAIRAVELVSEPE
jgi:succinyl-CoA synthetase beta subunit